MENIIVIEAEDTHFNTRVNLERVKIENLLPLLGILEHLQYKINTTLQKELQLKKKEE